MKGFGDNLFPRTQYMCKYMYLQKFGPLTQIENERLLPTAIDIPRAPYSDLDKPSTSVDQ